MTLFTKILSIITVLLALCLNISQAYCVYNRLDGESSRLYMYKTLADPRISFKKHVYNGEKECCPWDNKECNTSGSQEVLIYFHVKFGFFGENIDDSDTFLVSCTGGGGLVLSGSSSYNMTAICNYANGTVRSKIISAIHF